MTDRELLARKGHEVKDDLPDVVHIAREAVYASLMSTQDGTAETMAYADAYARAAVLAERERCAKVCEADPDAVFSAIWKSLVIPGEFDAMDDTDKNRWRGVIMQAIGLTSEKCAAAIRAETTKRPEPKPGA